MKKSIGMLAIGFALVSTAVQAQEKKENSTAASWIEKLDTDQDQKLSKEELKANARLSRHFEEIDTNEDQYLSEDELRAVREKRKELHANRKKLTQIRDEKRKQLQAEREEVTETRKQQREQVRQQRKELAATRIEKRKQMRAKQRTRIKARAQKRHAQLLEIDINNDHLISKEEAEKSNKKGLIKNFDKIDTNNDGYLSPKELKALRAKARAAERIKRKA